MFTTGVILAAYGTAMFLLSLRDVRRARRFHSAAKHFYEMAGEDAAQLRREHEQFLRDLDAAFQRAGASWLN